MTDRRDEQGVDVQGLGISLSPRDLAALLDPETRAAAHIRINLTNLAVRVSGETLREFIASLSPDGGITIGLAAGQLDVQLPDQPRMRLRVPIDGLNIRFEDDALAIEPQG